MHRIVGVLFPGSAACTLQELKPVEHTFRLIGRNWRALCSAGMVGVAGGHLMKYAGFTLATASQAISSKQKPLNKKICETAYNPVPRCVCC